MVEKERIEQLPKWARVAYAARCARRVEPLFTASWPDAPEEHVRNLDWTLLWVERMAGDLKSRDILASGADDHGLHAMEYSAVREAYSAARETDVVERAASVAYSVSCAATAADGVGNPAVRAVSAAANASQTAPKAACAACAGDVMDAALESDFESLLNAARREKWTDETPVSPEFFGPMWPHGLPEGWPVEAENSEGAELVFEVEIPDNASDEEVVNMVTELADRADSVHRAHGGNGLRISDLDIFGDVPVHAEVAS